MIYHPSQTTSEYLNILQDGPQTVVSNRPTLELMTSPLNSQYPIGFFKLALAPTRASYISVSKGYISSIISS